MPVFHENFKIVSIRGRDDAGGDIYEDVTPRKDALDELENSILQDAKQNTVVKINPDGNSLVHYFLRNSFKIF